VEINMGWIGKMVGGGIGFVLGGPLGAILGATFGHAFDADNQPLSNETSQLRGSRQAQLTFFVAVFSMLAKLAKSDGNVSQKEIDSIEQFMVKDLNLDSEGKRVSINVFRTAIDSPETFQSFAMQFYNQFNMQPQMLEFMIDILLRVSIADGVLSQGEEKLILFAAKTFNFSEEKYLKIKSRHINDVDKYYAILGCSSNDPDEAIKKSYRKLVFEYHPDTIASKGLPEEFTKFACDKFQEIQNAYESIKKERGL
jgi:DnaJ like chaperone protein